MKCNLECPYSKPNGRDRNGNQSIICESRNWYMTDTDDCIEKFDEKTISQLKGIFGDTIMPREKFRVFTEIPTNEKMIVNMITDDQLTLEDACVLLNKQDQQIKELEQELFSTKVEQLDERLAEYGGPDDEETWKKEFGMSQREAKKKAGWFDWEMYPE